MTSRRRSRYAPDREVERVLRLAKQAGLTPAGVRLGADGSVTVLDSRAAKVLSEDGEGAVDDYQTWKRREGRAAGNQ